MSGQLKLLHMSSVIHYPGEELELFEEAKNWKAYMSGMLQPYIRGKVLEVGAGMGETTCYLFTSAVSQWTCLEPDPNLFALLEKKKRENKLPSNCQPKQGTIINLAETEIYDTIIYIDVLEHIKNDKEELDLATAHLSTGGRLLVVSPAYRLLYGPFDKAIGHYRRYGKKSLRAAARNPFLKEEKIFHLESAGISLLMLNTFFLRRKYPGKMHIRIWDSLFIPISKLLDKILFFRIGKSIIGIWQKR